MEARDHTVGGADRVVLANSSKGLRALLEPSWDRGHQSQASSFSPSPPETPPALVWVSAAGDNIDAEMEGGAGASMPVTEETDGDRRKGTGIGGWENHRVCGHVCVCKHTGSPCTHTRAHTGSSGLQVSSLDLEAAASLHSTPLLSTCPPGLALTPASLL